MDNSHSGRKVLDHESLKEHHHRSAAHLTVSGVTMLAAVDSVHCSECERPGGDGHDARNALENPEQRMEIWVHPVGGGETGCCTDKGDVQMAIVGSFHCGGPPLQVGRMEDEHHLDAQTAHVELFHGDMYMMDLETNCGHMLALGTRAAKTFGPEMVCHKVLYTLRQNLHFLETRVKEVDVNDEEVALGLVHNDASVRDVA